MSTTFVTSTSSFAMQTTTAGSTPFNATPPLLPAFLITGLLLTAIVFIVIWRRLIEHRNAAQREEDPTWPADGMGSSGGPKGPTPKLWDLEVMSESERAMWGDIMPLSAALLRAAPKPRRPRYLIPSDRPVPFLTRMFGGERRPVRHDPPISLIAPSYPRPLVSLPEEDEEDPVNRLQVAVLISLPHPRRVRRVSYLQEKTRESTDTPSLSSEKDGSKSVGEGSEVNGASSNKGKKRSLETSSSHGYDPKAYYDYDDEEGSLEVAFGTVVLPFSGEG